MVEKKELTPLELAALDVVNGVSAHAGASFRGSWERTKDGREGPWSDADLTEDEKSTARELMNALVRLVKLGNHPSAK